MPDHTRVDKPSEQREFADLGMCECGCFAWVRYPLKPGFEQWHCTFCHTAHPLLRRAS